MWNNSCRYDSSCLKWQTNNWSYLQFSSRTMCSSLWWWRCFNWTTQSRIISCLRTVILRLSSRQMSSTIISVRILSNKIVITWDNSIDSQTKDCWEGGNCYKKVKSRSVLHTVLHKCSNVQWYFKYLVTEHYHCNVTSLWALWYLTDWPVNHLLILISTSGFWTKSCLFHVS